MASAYRTHVRAIRLQGDVARPKEARHHAMLQLVPTQEPAFTELGLQVYGVVFRIEG